MCVCVCELHKIIHLKFKYVHTCNLSLLFNTFSFPPRLPSLSLLFAFALILPSETTVKKVPPSQSPSTPFNSYFVLSFRFQLQPLLSNRHIRYLIQFETLRGDVTGKNKNRTGRNAFTAKQPRIYEHRRKHTHTHSHENDAQIRIQFVVFQLDVDFARAREHYFYGYQIAYNYLIIYYTQNPAHRLSHVRLARLCFCFCCRLHSQCWSM